MALFAMGFDVLADLFKGGSRPERTNFVEQLEQLELYKTIFEKHPSREDCCEVAARSGITGAAIVFAEILHDSTLEMSGSQVAELRERLCSAVPASDQFSLQDSEISSQHNTGADDQDRTISTFQQESTEYHGQYQPPHESAFESFIEPQQQPHLTQHQELSNLLIRQTSSQSWQQNASPQQQDGQFGQQQSFAEDQNNYSDLYQGLEESTHIQQDAGPQHRPSPYTHPTQAHRPSMYAEQHRIHFQQQGILFQQPQSGAYDPALGQQLPSAFHNSQSHQQQMPDQSRAAPIQQEQDRPVLSDPTQQQRASKRAQKKAPEPLRLSEQPYQFPANLRPFDGVSGVVTEQQRKWLNDGKWCDYWRTRIAEQVTGGSNFGLQFTPVMDGELEQAMAIKALQHEMHRVACDPSAVNTIPQAGDTQANKAKITKLGQGIYDRPNPRHDQTAVLKPGKNKKTATADDFLYVDNYQAKRVGQMNPTLVEIEAHEILHALKDSHAGDHHLLPHTADENGIKYNGKLRTFDDRLNLAVKGLREWKSIALELNFPSRLHSFAADPAAVITSKRQNKILNGKRKTRYDLAEDVENERDVVVADDGVVLVDGEQVTIAPPEAVEPAKKRRRRNQRAEDGGS